MPKTKPGWTSNKNQLETVWRSPSDIIMYAKNSKLHPPEQVKQIADSIVEFGFLDPIAIDENGEILEGHGRYLAAELLQLKSVPTVQILGLTEAQKVAYRVAHNKLTMNSDFDPDLLKLDMEFLSEMDFDLTLTGFDSEDLSSYLEIDTTEYQAPENQGDRLQDTKTTEENKEVSLDSLDNAEIEETEEIKIRDGLISGSIWKLGDHFLMCGDCTDENNIKKLVKTANIKNLDMVFTSPPYNAGNSKTGAYSGGSAGRDDFKKLYSEFDDNLSKEDYFNFCLKVLENINSVSREETTILWNICYNAKSRDDYGKIIFSDRNPFTVKETIIWDKGVGQNIVSTGILSRTCEFIFLMSRGNKYFTNQNKEVYWNVWRISNKDGESMQLGHGATFPVKLPGEAITRFSKESSVVYDPFLGSGTTLIACEQLNRKCLGTEISPKYCEIIMQRWEKLTGNKSVKI